jgi:hypothetical protein
LDKPYLPSFRCCKRGKCFFYFVFAFATFAAAAHPTATPKGGILNIVLTNEKVFKAQKKQKKY